MARTDPHGRRASVVKVADDRDAQLRERYAASRRAVADAIMARSQDEIAVLVSMLNDLAGQIRRADDD